MKRTKRDLLKIYAVLITVCGILVLAAFCVVFHHAGYDKKVLIKLGIKEIVEETTVEETTVEETTQEINWAVVGWNNTLEKLDYDADVVFFGDSITRGSDFRSYFPELKIVNLGYSGDGLKGMLNRVSGVAAVSPEKVFVLGGINGLKDNNIDDCIFTYTSLMDVLSDALPDAEIYIQSVLPIASSKEEIYCHNTSIVKFNSELKQLASEKGVKFIDLHSLYVLNGEMNPELTTDGVHLQTEAYSLWADEISGYLN